MTYLLPIIVLEVIRCSPRRQSDCRVHHSMVSRRVPLYSSASRLPERTSSASNGITFSFSASNPKILRYIRCVCRFMLGNLDGKASLFASTSAACRVSHVSATLGRRRTRACTCFIRPVNPYAADITGASASTSPCAARSSRRAIRRPNALSLEAWIGRSSWTWRRNWSIVLFQQNEAANSSSSLREARSRRRIVDSACAACAFPPAPPIVV